MLEVRVPANGVEARGALAGLSPLAIPRNSDSGRDCGESGDGAAASTRYLISIVRHNSLLSCRIVLKLQSGGLDGSVSRMSLYTEASAASGRSTLPERMR
jgi:hypothetical protein